MVFRLVSLCVISLECIIFMKRAEANRSLTYQQTLFGWKKFDYDMPQGLRDDLIQSGGFIPENNIFSSVKIDGKRKRIFMTFPRYREGVPSSLNYINLDPNPHAHECDTLDFKNTRQGPDLRPFPSWEFNELGNCDVVQNALAIEIDGWDRLWVVDGGRVNVLARSPINKCPPKLVVIDLRSREGNVLHTHIFPHEVVNRTKHMMNQITLGCISAVNCWAYISEPQEGKIIVFSMEINRSWAVTHFTMNANKGESNIYINGASYFQEMGVSGISLSPYDTNYDMLYYSPLASIELYAVPTAFLQTSVNDEEIPDFLIHWLGRKATQAKGMVIDAKGRLYYGALRTNSIMMWPIEAGKLREQNIVNLVSNDTDLQYVESFGFDDRGFLYGVATKYHRFAAKTLDFKATNFRIVRVYIGSQSYMHSVFDKY